MAFKRKLDGFPALEVFIEDLETEQVDLMYFDNTSDAGEDLRYGNNPKEILNLFPKKGDIKIDKTRQIGLNPQIDQPNPSAKVEENNKRFKKYVDCKCGPAPAGNWEKVN